MGSIHILSSGLVNSNSAQKLLGEDRRDIVKVTTSQLYPDLVLISLCGSLRWLSPNISLKETQWLRCSAFKSLAVVMGVLMNALQFKWTEIDCTKFDEKEAK